VKALQAFAKSDIGRVREINEDNFLCLSPLFVVADGMGGHVAGEIASKMATDIIKKCIIENNHLKDPALALAEAISEANTEVYRFSRENGQYAGMGTTVTAAYIDGKKIYWCHVGDSRIYLIRDDQMTQITPDHSLVGELVRSGNITPDEALIHPQRNILTRAVGTGETILSESGIIDCFPGDSLLLCTDGLTNMVCEEEILGVVKIADKDAALVLETLVQMANSAGGVDNITAILVQCGEAKYD
jgi:PPM family protein phosphatase